jgi:hypothetical protein
MPAAAPAGVARPDVHMLCHGLWNSSALAVAYNRERLGLDARASDSRIEQAPGAIDFAVHDRATGTPLVAGHVERPRRPSLRANLALIARLGLVRLVALARQPWIRMQILSPVGAGLGRNALAESFTRAGTSVLRYFDPARDRLEIHAPRYRALGFRPEFLQAMAGFKFVYLDPR